MPFYFIKTVGHSEKDEWIRRAQAETRNHSYQGNDIYQNFEPIKGWRPFEKYGENPIQIIHNCIQDYDNTVNKILFRKDKFSYNQYYSPQYSPGEPHPSMNVLRISGQIAGFNFYKNSYGNPRNALIVPTEVGEETSVYNIMTGPTDYFQSMLADSYRNYSGKVPSDAMRYILYMNLPYVDTANKVCNMYTRFFPPSVFEVDRSISANRPEGFEYIDMMGVRISANPESDCWFYTRDSHQDSSPSQPAVRIGQYNDRTISRIDSERPLFPCFCIG